MRASTIAMAALLALPACKTEGKKKATEATSNPPVISTAPNVTLPTYVATEITELDVAHDDKRFIFRRRADGEWMIIKPKKTLADRKSVEAALTELSRIEGDPGGSAPVSLRRQDWARYQVSPEQSVVIRTRAGERQLPVLHLGRKNWVRVGDSAAVLVAYHINYFSFARPEMRLWRDRQVARLHPKKVNAIDITDQRGRVVKVVREAGTWKLTAGAKLVGAFDATAPDALVSRVQSLIAHDAAEVTAKDAGLEKPRATIVLHQVKGSFTIKVGASKGGFTYVSSSRNDTIWTLKDHAAKPLVVTPTHWRKR